jgi:nucleoside triphosphate diphosphatase
MGFDWPDALSVFAKISEELVELRDELERNADPASVEDEMGDILFAAANLARKLDIDPEAALRRATDKFERRFRRVEALAVERAAGTALERLEELWQEVKRQEYDDRSHPRHSEED